MIRVLIADDHALIRSGLMQIIATTDDMMVAAEAVNGAETLDLVQKNRFGMVLMDMDMPDPGGVELITRVRKQQPLLPILILSMHNEGQIIRRALAAGASGYVSKTSDPRILIGAIRKVASGGRFIDPALIDAAVFDDRGDDLLSQGGLTERELQVLRMIGSGLPIGKVAGQLHLSPKTVSTHKMRLMKKLDIDNNADLILFAFHHGLANN